MNLKNPIWIRIIVGAFLLGCLVSMAKSESADSKTWLAAVQDEAARDEATASAKPGGWKKPIPLSFSLDYTLVSDYIWRGLNFSEYSGEGRERCNHQMTTGVSYDTGNLGEFGFSVWFEWYSGQKTLDPNSDGYLQEVDYTVCWSYDISNLTEWLPVTFETGWIAYTFPQLAGDAHKTNEWYVTLSFDDSALFGTENGVLNPYISYYMDCDDVKGSWIEWGISHDFAFAEMGMKDLPVLKDLTLTPSFTMGIDHNFMTPPSGKSTRLATLVYGLALSYDLSGALNIPEQFGSLSVTGFLNYSQVPSDSLKRGNYMNDEFWGGVTIAYEW